MKNEKTQKSSSRKHKTSSKPPTIGSIDVESKEVVTINIEKQNVSERIANLGQLDYLDVFECAECDFQTKSYRFSTAFNVSKYMVQPENT